MKDTSCCSRTTFHMSTDVDNEQKWSKLTRSSGSSDVVFNLVNSILSLITRGAI